MTTMPNPIKLLTKKSTIALSNSLIMSGRRKPLRRRHGPPPINVTKMFLLLCAQVHAKKDKSFQFYELSANALWAELGHEGRIGFEQLSDLLLEFMSHVTMVIDADGLPQPRRWFADGTGCRMENGTVIVKMRLHDDMLPFVTDLQNKYTKLMARDILKCRSPYDPFLYQVVAQYLGPWNREDHPPVPLDVLIDALQIPSATMASQQWRVFENDILKPARERIQRHTLLRFQYRPVRLGNRKRGTVFGVQFYAVRLNNVVEAAMEETAMAMEDASPSPFMRKLNRMTRCDDIPAPYSLVHSDPYADE